MILLNRKYCLPIILITMIPLNLTSDVINDTLTTPESDRVYYLPGLDHEINDTIYSGYLKVSKTRYFHYVFIESKNDEPLNDPIILWLNGGPGCSSLEGMFMANGPWEVANNGHSLIDNKYSWTKFANMLYLESPVWTGFSYGKPIIDSFGSDNETARDNMKAIELFFEKFPSFKSSPFYLTGFSYAGVYIPTLSVLLLNNNEINYQGFAIGNGLLDLKKMADSIIDFAYGRGLITRNKWLLLRESCCRNETVDDEEFACDIVDGTVLGKVCRNLILSQILVEARLHGINLYNVNHNCKRVTDLSDKLMEKKDDFGWRLLYSVLKIDQNQLTNNLNVLYTCVHSDDLEVYLGKSEVRKALNIPSKVSSWTACNKLIEASHRRQYESMRKQILATLAGGKRGLIYNGDADLVCNFLGNNWFADELELKVIKQYSPWFYEEKIAGFIKQFEGLQVVSLIDAGHYAIRDKPAEAFKMMKAFVTQEQLE